MHMRTVRNYDRTGRRRAEVGVSSVSPELVQQGWTDDVERLSTTLFTTLQSRAHLAPRWSVSLTRPSGEPIGQVQVLDSVGLDAVVAVGLSCPELSLSTLVAFTPADSDVPHLSFEAVSGRGATWASVDLMPRVACSEHDDYTAHVYEPLSDLLWSLHELEGTRQSQIRARHRMLLSPWLLSLEVEPVALPAVDAAVGAYVARFNDLVSEGLPDAASSGLSGDELAARDEHTRRRLYSWDATANYRFIELLCGPDSVDLIQGAFRSPAEPVPSVGG
jgi:hypothetical protein